MSLNVGVQNVRAVITTVLKNVVHKSAERLPSRTTLCDMMIESLMVAQAQLGEELTREETNYHTLQTDGTTKYGEHFATYDKRLMKQFIIWVFARYFQGLLKVHWIS